jgi:uncharacterized OB-fold protein
MSWEPRQLPDLNPETKEYWESASEGILKLKQCSECENILHYPRSKCTECFGETTWIEAEGMGTIYSYSVSEKVQGWPENKSPHIMAYVELEEGIQFLTIIEDVDPDNISIGDQVEVEFVDTKEEDISIPVFTPL